MDLVEHIEKMIKEVEELTIIAVDSEVKRIQLRNDIYKITNSMLDNQSLTIEEKNIIFALEDKLNDAWTYAQIDINGKRIK